MASNSFATLASPQPSRSFRRFSRFPVAVLQRENVMRPLDQLIGIEFGDDLVAQALDVEGIARGEMLEPLDPLCGTDQAAGAAPHRIESCPTPAPRAPHAICTPGIRSGTHRAPMPDRASPECGRGSCGMTSPARCTITVSPMRISLRAISSSLCSVALETTTPPTVTGFSRATGVSAPVRPT